MIPTGCVLLVTPSRFWGADAVSRDHLFGG
jgi:hypothetical protein